MNYRFVYTTDEHRKKPTATVYRRCRIPMVRENPAATVPEDYRISLPVNQREYLCNGEIRTWDGPAQDVYSPVCTGNADTAERVYLGRYPLLAAREAEKALAAACGAYDRGRGKWPMMSVEKRISGMLGFVDAMKEVRRDVVALLMWEIGKTLPDAEKEFDRTVDYILDTVEALKELDRTSSRFDIVQGVIGKIRRAPLGVVLCMGPFNYPLNETFTTLIPALLMGNTVIFKPPKLGVLLHRPLLEAFRASFPAGVVNTVYGDGQEVIAPLMESGRVDVLAFIGSSRVADILKKQHPKPHRLRAVLGLEAKNAGIVLPDADLPAAVKECVLGSLSYNGQRCTALKILFVHARIADAFLEAFCRGVTALKAGLPWEEGVRITPLPEEGKTAAMRELVDDAVRRGARIVNDGGGEADATLMKPAVVYPVGPGMKLYDTEQFGPVVPVCPFTDTDEVLAYVSNSDYGQQVSVFGTDPEMLAGLIDPLAHQVCRVNINSQCQRGPDVFPFTGRKDSAEGTLSVGDALKVFSIRTMAAAKNNETNRTLLGAMAVSGKTRILSNDFIF